MERLLQERTERLQQIYLGGGAKAIAKQKEKGKLTPRERIDYLVDEGTSLLELGAFAGYGMYAEHGGCPAGDNKTATVDLGALTQINQAAI